MWPVGSVGSVGGASSKQTWSQTSSSGCFDNTPAAGYRTMKRAACLPQRGVSGRTDGDQNFVLWSRKAERVSKLPHLRFLLSGRTSNWFGTNRGGPAGSPVTESWFQAGRLKGPTSSWFHSPPGQTLRDEKQSGPSGLHEEQLSDLRSGKWGKFVPKSVWQKANQNYLTCVA